jgi:hypothetical protein
MAFGILMRKDWGLPRGERGVYASCIRHVYKISFIFTRNDVRWNLAHFKRMSRDEIMKYLQNRTSIGNTIYNISFQSPSSHASIK